MTRVIELSGFDELAQALEEIPETALPILGGAMAQSLELVRGIVAEYPPVKRPSRRSVYGQPFKSDKQRRFFFAALRDGRIRVPYVRGMDPRSEALGQAWATQVEAGPEAITGLLGNNSSYFEVVQGDNQSEYMKAVGWKTIDQGLDEAEPEVDILFDQAVDQVVDAWNRGE